MVKHMSAAEMSSIFFGCVNKKSEDVCFGREIETGISFIDLFLIS